MGWVARILRAALGWREPTPMPQIRAWARSTGDPELDPLVSFLRVHFEREIRDGRTILIKDRTCVDTFFVEGSYQRLVDILEKQASDRVPIGLIRDFVEKNRDSSPVWPALTQHLPARLIDFEERREIFRDDDKGWSRLYQRYPGATGIVTVSRVGLSRDPERALFYLANVWGGLAAVGGFHVLEREGDFWVKLPVGFGMNWLS